MNEKPTISAIIIAKNEVEMIANCLETLRWCDEVIVVDHDSSDATAGLAKQAGARLVKGEGSFAQLRNQGLRAAKTDWVLYIDADERVTPALAQEIQAVINAPRAQAYQLNRLNMLYGQVFSHGGWQHDRIVRLFERRSLVEWQGDVHEHAEVKGETGMLQQSLLHLTHRSVISGLHKTIEWIPIEAKLLFEAGAPPVTPLTLARKFGMELWRRIVWQQGYRDGMPGWVEAWVQAFNRLLVYLILWELQQRPSLAERYQNQDKDLIKQWHPKS